jgi:hypothetical protein
VEITLGNNPIPCPNSEDVSAGTILYCCGPIASLLIGAILFLGRELRRYNNNRTLPSGGQPATAQSIIGVDIAGIQKPTITGNPVGQELDAQNQVYELPYPTNV